MPLYLLSTQFLEAILSNVILWDSPARILLGLPSSLGIKARVLIMALGVWPLASSVSVSSLPC